MKAMLLAVLLFFAPTRAGYRKATNEEVTKYAQAFNNDYFGGKLPPVEVTFVEDLRDDSGNPVMGLTIRGNPYRIFLNARYQDNSTIYLETELHEECHVEVDREVAAGEKFPDLDVHGDNFQACMYNKLAAVGALHNLW